MFTLLTVQASDFDRAFLTLGDPTAPVFPRSSNKPMQAVAMLRAGLEHTLVLAHCFRQHLSFLHCERQRLFRVDVEPRLERL